MKKIVLSFVVFFATLSTLVYGQNKLDSLVPVRGLCISAPGPEDTGDFIKFIKKELVPRKVNLLVLRIDYRYSYTSHPELKSENPLTREDVKKIVNACQEGGIKIIPQVNLLGHQSWAGTLGNLLKLYPQFDENPEVEMPQNYKWPNDDGLYCKSYCPLHPEVHQVVFDIVDEIIEVFEADAFHAGMDEVFYIGNDKCPRCGGRDKAELFAGEVTKIRNHLALKGKELWIWGDRLLDGKETGMGMWEASMNNTHRAIDLIPKDVVINDWHYVKAGPSAAYFAMKGFKVVSCPWRYGHVAKAQLEYNLMYKENSNPIVGERFIGMMQTVWSGAREFMDQYYGKAPSENERGGDQVECFKQLFEEIGALK